MNGEGVQYLADHMASKAGGELDVVRNSGTSYTIGALQRQYGGTSKIYGSEYTYYDEFKPTDTGSAVHDGSIMSWMTTSNQKMKNYKSLSPAIRYYPTDNGWGIGSTTMCPK